MMAEVDQMIDGRKETEMEKEMGKMDLAAPASANCGREMTRDEVWDLLREERVKAHGSATLAAEERGRRGEVERKLALAQRQLNVCARLAVGMEPDAAYWTDAVAVVRELRKQMESMRERGAGTELLLKDSRAAVAALEKERDTARSILEATEKHGGELQKTVNEQEAKIARMGVEHDAVLAQARDLQTRLETAAYSFKHARAQRDEAWKKLDRAVLRLGALKKKEKKQGRR